MGMGQSRRNGNYQNLMQNQCFLLPLKPMPNWQMDRGRKNKQSMAALTLSTFIATDTITVKNVLLGEVWLASGQSNMEFFMSKTKNASYAGVIDYEKEIAAADYPAIRMIDVANKTAGEPQDEFYRQMENLLTSNSSRYLFRRSLLFRA